MRKLASFFLVLVLLGIIVFSVPVSADGVP